MTVSSATSKVIADGNGVATVFSFNPIVIFAETEISVTKTSATGVETTAVLGTDYTVEPTAGVYPSTGSITWLGTVLATGESLTMKRVLDFLQGLDMENQGEFLAEDIEEALDRAHMIDIQQQESIDRSLRGPVSDTAAIGDLPTKANRQGKVLAFDANGDPVGSTMTLAAIEAGATDASASATAAAASATSAATSATSASASATAAAASAAQADAAAASVGFSDVVFLTHADSPYSVGSGDAGKLLSIDTSGGAFTINLPQISTLALPFTVGAKKSTDDANSITISTGGTDTFDDGTTSKEIAAIYGTTLIPDTDPNPDVWTAADWAGAGIADGAITTAKIADQAVTQAKLDPAIVFVPTGCVLPYAGATEPTGFLLCYGQAVSRTTYSALFTAIGTVYGTGDGSTTFNLPDLRGRVVAGKDNMGGTAANRLTSGGSGITGTTLGATGGAETHTLTTAQMPSHNHGVTDPGHTHPIAVDPSGNVDDVQSLPKAGRAATTTYNSNSNTTGITIQNNGSGTAHNNVQPTIILNYIIKT